MKRQRRFEIPADVLRQALEAKCFPDLNGEEVSSCETQEGIRFTRSVDLDGITSNEDVTLDAKEVQDVAEQKAKLTTGSFSCTVDNKLTHATVINTSSESPRRK